MNDDLLDAQQRYAAVTVSGNEGDDTLLVGAGVDTLNGDDGHDVLIGDAGQLTIVDWFSSNANAKLDAIQVKEDNVGDGTGGVSSYGHTLRIASINALETLVQSMATFAANNGGVPSALTQDVRDLHDNSIGVWVTG